MHEWLIMPNCGWSSFGPSQPLWGKWYQIIIALRKIAQDATQINWNISDNLETNIKQNILNNVGF